MTTLLFFGIATANVLKILRTHFCSFADNFLIIINSVHCKSVKLQTGTPSLSSYCQGARAAEGYMYLWQVICSYCHTYCLKFQLTGKAYKCIYLARNSCVQWTSNSFICWVFMSAAPAIVSQLGPLSTSVGSIMTLLVRIECEIRSSPACHHPTTCNYFNLGIFGCVIDFVATRYNRDRGSCQFCSTTMAGVNTTTCSICNSHMEYGQSVENILNVWPEEVRYDVADDIINITCDVSSMVHSTAEAQVTYW